MILLMSLIALAAPILPLDDPTDQDFSAILSSPTSDHLLGADQLGRDTLSRLIHGARTSLMVGILAQVIVLGVGIPVGLLAGIASSRVDNLIMRSVDIVYAFPDLLLIILLRAIFGGSPFTMLLAIGLVSWPTVARLVRGQALSLRERDYVLAARATGASSPHIMWHHLLPNAIGPVVVAATFLVPRAIFAEAALSYIGFGINPPTPSWGTMVSDGYSVIFAAYEPAIVPSAALVLLMMAFTFLGDGLRDLLDPRSLASQRFNNR